MVEKYTKFIKNQIAKLDLDEFDLEAWKSSTIAALQRIYEKSDPKISQIEQLKIDYSSWALRDSNANYNPVESCKNKGREVLRTAIEELEILGLEPTKEDKESNKKLPREVQDIVDNSSKWDLKKKLLGLKKETLVNALIKSLD